MDFSASIPIPSRPQICDSASGCTAGGVGTTRSTVPQGTQYIPVGTRPNPYLSAGFFWFTEGNSSYNALQVDLTRRLSKGLQFRANYTWSKNLDMNSGLTIAQAQNQPQMIYESERSALGLGTFGPECNQPVEHVHHL